MDYLESRNQSIHGFFIVDIVHICLHGSPSCSHLTTCRHYYMCLSLTPVDYSRRLRITLKLRNRLTCNFFFCCFCESLPPPTCSYVCFAASICQSRLSLLTVLLPFCYLFASVFLLFPYSFASAGPTHSTWSLSFVLFLMFLLPVVPGVVEIFQYNLAQQNSETVWDIDQPQAVVGKAIGLSKRINFQFFLW